MAGRKVNIALYSGSEDPNESAWAKAHRDLLDGFLRCAARLMQCLVCGDPVSENKAVIAEMDEEGCELAVGCVHQRCHRPSLRVLGEIRSEVFARYASLKDFDYEAWILAFKNGPSAISNEQLTSGAAYAGWKSKPIGNSRGRWCIRIDLEDGSAGYGLDRSKVLRLGQADAERYAAELSASFEKSAANRDPFCYTSDRTIYGTYKSIAARLKPGQKLLKCVKAEACEFSAAIDVAFSHKNSYYAPMVVLVELETGRPIQLGGEAVPLLTNPFELSGYIENWSAAGIIVGPYAVSIIASDEEFDTHVRHCLERELPVVIDPIVDMQGNLLKGLVVRPLEDLTAEQ